MSETLISDAELQWMRDAAAELLPDVCTILRPTNTSDGQGGWVTTWGTVAANVKCRLDIGNRDIQETITGATLKPHSWWMLTLPYNQTIDATWRVVIGGQSYNVINHDSGKSWQIATRAVVTKA